MEPAEHDAATSGGSAPAPGWRALTFRFGGVCGAGCGVPVSAGEAGFWNPATKELRHAGCSPSAAIARPERVPWTGLPTPSDDWQRLVAYCRACVLREGLGEPPGYEDFATRWAVVAAGPESILAGTDETLPIGEEIRSVVGGHRAELKSAGTSATAEELAFGWPLVVCRDSWGKLRCAPLVIATVRSPGPRAKELEIDRTSVQLNVAVADPRFQPDADPTLLRTLAEEPLPLGSADVLASRLEEISLEAGLTINEPLDARSLRGGRPPAKPGIYNRAVVLRREPSRMTAQLLADLKRMFNAGEPDWSRTAAAWLVRGSAPTSSRTTSVVSANRLNAPQEAAVARALASPVSVITGPPGTGKSQFVAALVATARDQDLKVLVASTNNGAVDEAVGRASAAHPATILRTGNAEYRKRLIGTLEEICGGASRRAADGDQDPAIGTGRADREGARAAHRAMTVRRDHARARLGARAEELRRLDEASRVAADAAQALWGGPPPAEVAGDPGGVLAAAVPARRRWRRRAREKLLSDLGLGSPEHPTVALDALIGWARATLLLRRAHEQLGEGPRADEWDAWEERDRAWLDAGRTLVAATAAACIDEQATERLEGLLKAYRSDDGKQGRALLAFLDVLPAWATSALSVRSSFACEPAIFDLVVIDEASQCTLPAVLPLAFRASRIVIVGDPNQLPPVVTVPPSELEHLPGVAGLDGVTLLDRGQRYGIDSSYTAFSRLVDDELLLDEHYRCHPEIARYCDEEFYGGRLHVLTDTWRALPQPVRGLEWIQVDGEAEAGRPGGRVNEAELEAVVAWVVANEAGLRAAGAELGVVTPFAAQASLLRTRVGRALGRARSAELNLRVGTAHTFQGAERDVMLFSPVVAAGTPAGTIDWLEKNRYLVNVAVSRARLGLVVLGDARQLKDLGAATLLSLHAHATSRPGAEGASERAQAALIAHLPTGIDVRLGERIADYPASVTLRVGARTTVVVTEIGERDAAQRLRGLQRDRNMLAAGAAVVRVPAWLCHHDPAAAAGLVVAGASGHAATAGERSPAPVRSPAGPWDAERPRTGGAS